MGSGDLRSVDGESRLSDGRGNQEDKGSESRLHSEEEDQGGIEEGEGMYKNR